MIKHHVLAQIVLLHEIEDKVARLNQVLEVRVQAF
jgi:hypothetical protein